MVTGGGAVECKTALREGHEGGRVSNLLSANLEVVIDWWCEIGELIDEYYLGVITDWWIMTGKL